MGDIMLFTAKVTEGEAGGPYNNACYPSATSAVNNPNTGQKN